MTSYISTTFHAWYALHLWDIATNKPIAKAAESIAMAWMELVMLAIAGDGIGQRSSTQNTKNSSALLHINYTL